jgi:transcriptional regulator with XRE-family HTH domain
MKKNFADRLKEALEVNKMSQSELARKIGLTSHIVNRYCSGKAKPSFNALISICKVLDESADYLLGLAD